MVLQVERALFLAAGDAQLDDQAADQLLAAFGVSGLAQRLALVVDGQELLQLHVQCIVRTQAEAYQANVLAIPSREVEVQVGRSALVVGGLGVASLVLLDECHGISPDSHVIECWRLLPLHRRSLLLILPFKTVGLGNPNENHSGFKGL